MYSKGRVHNYIGLTRTGRALIPRESFPTEKIPHVTPSLYTLIVLRPPLPSGISLLTPAIRFLGGLDV